jgi:hypothetical protein
MLRENAGNSAKTAKWKRTWGRDPSGLEHLGKVLCAYTWMTLDWPLSDGSRGSGIL